MYNLQSVIVLIELIEVDAKYFCKCVRLGYAVTCVEE